MNFFRVLAGVVTLHHEKCAWAKTANEKADHLAMVASYKGVVTQCPPGLPEFNPFAQIPEREGFRRYDE
jgi:hypothetical protein